MRTLLLVLLLSTPSLAQAWVMDKQSTLQFTPHYTGYDIPSKFENFDVAADISENLKESSFTVDVDVLSAVADFGDVTTDIQKPIWFDSHNFPKAEFKTQSITHKEGQTYTIKGELTLKGTTAPVTGEFTVTEHNEESFKANFLFNINRLDFNIGNTEKWQNDGDLKFNVVVQSSLIMNQ